MQCLFRLRLARRAVSSAVAVMAMTAVTVLPLAAHAADTYAQTRYPVVLVHGLFGFESIGPIDYWYGITAALQSGGARVFVANVSAANSDEVRGEQLLAYLQRLKATYGDAKFNLVGHSQGGHTIRYVAAVAPGLVASVTSVGAPHTGSPVADDLKAATSATGTTAWATFLVDGFGTLLSLLSGNPNLPQHSAGALESISSSGSAKFNQTYPAGQPTSQCGQGAAIVNGVRYYSVGGTAVLTNPLDISDPILGLTSFSFKGSANDGLVGRCATHWGMVLRDDYPWNHLDEVNQAFGLRSIFAPDPVAFYRTQANRLKTAGL